MEGLLEKHSVASVDFLKVDIEVSEFALFSNDVGWLRRVNRVAIELHEDYGSPARIVATLSQHHFATSRIEHYLYAQRVSRG